MNFTHFWLELFALHWCCLLYMPKNIKVFLKRLFFIKFFLEAFKMQKFKSVEELINQLKPEKPVYCIRKNSIKSAVKFFLNKFTGKILYAVKTNPHPEVIKNNHRKWS